MASEIRKIRPDPFLTDEENGPLTEDEIARLRPGHEVLAELDITPPRPRGRPRKKRPKQQVSIRLDADILAALRATGKGWQTRVNAILHEWVEKCHESWQIDLPPLTRTLLSVTLYPIVAEMAAD